MNAAAARGEPGLYVHVPFCARACPYCDFDFVVGRSPDVSAYLKGLDAEVQARQLSGTAVRTVYVGGGTPSLLGASGLRRLFAQLRATFDTHGVLETTVELNPEHVDAALLDVLVEVGCDRVSLGAQTLDAGGLVQLGRVHSGAGALAAAGEAVGRGLAVSADLIVGWAGQTTDSLERDLNAFDAAGVEHLSVYALTIEPATPWEALVRRGKRSLPDDDHQATLLEHVAGWARRGGWDHYEVASYARSMASRAQHNAGYWTARDYVGLGPSAASAQFGMEGEVRRQNNVRGWAAWLNDPSVAEVETLDGVAAAVESLWLGLRLLGGVDVTTFLSHFPAVDRRWLDRRIQGSVRAGNLVWTHDGRLRVAPDRWLMHDAVVADLLEP